MAAESFCGFWEFWAQRKTIHHPLLAAPSCAEPQRFRLSNQHQSIAAPGTPAVAYLKQARVQTPTHVHPSPLSSRTASPAPATKLASQVSRILAIPRMTPDCSL